MTTTTTTTPPPPPQPSSSPPPLSVATTDETAAKNASKRYEGLMMVRTKAIKGKGAWYWSHLEPILVHNNNNNNNDNNKNNVVRQQVKLRCCLCGAVFSASNPSRTATEHLKRGTCPNFKSDPNNQNPTPISSVSPSGHVSMMTSSSLSPTGMMTSSHVSTNNRKRGKAAAQSVAPITMTRPDPVGGSGLYLTHNQQYSHFCKLSGGKDDLNALALLEDSVKKLKSPKFESSFGGQKLARCQIDASFDMLADWVYENCGLVSFSSLNHVKFKAFLSQVGLPAITGREIAGERLDSKYLMAKNESEARIRDAMFFQLSSNGWRHCKFRTDDGGENDRNLVNLSLNLPNGTSVFRRGVFTNGYVFPKYAEDVFMETIVEICGNNLQKCVGIVSDKFKMKALKNLENQHHWMVNLSCQYHGVSKLVQDFVKELPVFKNVIDGCYKVANFVNMNSQIRHSYLKYQFQELGRSRLFQVPKFEFEFEVVCSMVEDVFSSSRVLQLVLLDESNKVVSMEVEETIKSPQFWKETEGMHSLVRLVKDMAREIEKERPRIGQCLPLWEELRVKIKEWCLKYEMNEIHVENIFDKRFRKNYHPAWAAAFILDPFYLIRDRSGKYLPPFKCLTSEQEKDVDKLITRLVSREEAHIALMELMKWRTDGLDPVYAQAVQLKQRDPVTGKMKIANPQSSRLVWETYLTEFNSLRKVAVRLIFLHATSCEFKWNWSISRFCQLRNNGIDKAQKLIFIAANAKPERRDFTNDDAKETDFSAVANGEDDMLNEVLFDATPP